VGFISLPSKALRKYLDDEHRNKKKKPFDFTGWEDRVDEVGSLMNSEF
jgi:sentrin-specific protease 1